VIALSRRKRIILAIVAVAVIAGVAMLFQTLRYGFSAHDEPTHMEAFMATATRHYSVPSDLRDAKNPIPPAPEVLAEARAHFADHCATCHGNDGKGKTEMGPRLYPKVPDLTLAATQKQTDGELFATIENGIRMTGMPGWGEGTAASAYGSWTLVHFIRHLPEITPEEVGEMEKLNPKSPEEWQEMQAESEFLNSDRTGSAEATAETMQHKHKH
jgi:mono/diheme cytochrome c family protein